MRSILGSTSRIFRRMSLAVLLVIALLGYFYFSSHVKAATTNASLVSGPVDLLAPATRWQAAGVTQQASTHQLNVVPTDLAIVKQDGTPGQNSPAINLYGSRLQTKGDFQVTVDLTDATGASRVSLYGTPPIIEDEFRAEVGTLDLDIAGSTFTATVHKQQRGNNVDKLSRSITSGSHHSVVISAIGNKLHFKVDQQDPGTTLPARSIFKTGNVWFGLSATPNNGLFTVDQLSAQGLGKGLVATTDASNTQVAANPAGLAAMAQSKRPGFMLGAAVAEGPMVADPSYMSLLSNFNAISIENAGKFQTIHPQAGNSPTSYNFNDMDAIVAIASKTNMKIHGHALVFGEANPAWVQNIAKTHPEQLQQVMIDQITTVMQHYAGKVSSWDVVNEPLADYDTTPGQYGLRQNIWYNAMGPDYIATALTAAHAADPSAKLWLNDFGLESDDARFAQMISLVKRLQAAGVPLTGVGFQSHLDSDDTDAADAHINVAKLRGRFQTLQSLGLSARVSELDVSSPSEYPAYADVVSACIQQTNCVGVTTWGITNKYSSGGQINAKGVFVPGIGLPWDSKERALSPVNYIKQTL